MQSSNVLRTEWVSRANVASPIWPYRCSYYTLTVTHICGVVNFLNQRSPNSLHISDGIVCNASCFIWQAWSALAYLFQFQFVDILGFVRMKLLVSLSSGICASRTHGMHLHRLCAKRHWWQKYKSSYSVLFHCYTAWCNIHKVLSSIDFTQTVFQILSLYRFFAVLMTYTVSNFGHLFFCAII